MDMKLARFLNVGEFRDSMELSTALERLRQKLGHEAFSLSLMRNPTRR
jgi:hypothetical protein